MILATTLIDWRSALVIGCFVVIAICIGLLTDIVPKHRAWKRENKK